MNNVFVSGKLVALDEGDSGKFIVMTLETTEYYGYGGDQRTRVNSHEVILASATQEVVEAARRHNELKKPLYLALGGMLAERRLNDREEEKRVSQVYIQARNVYALSDEALSTDARATFGGEIVYAAEKETKNGKPYTRLLVRNVRERGERTYYTVLPVNIYRPLSDLALEKGDPVVLEGKLDSWRNRDYDVWTTEMKAFEYTRAVSEAVDEDAEFSDDAASGVVAQTQMGLDLDSTPAPDEDLPF